MVVQIVSHTVLIIGAVLFVFPFLWLVSTSLKPDTQIFLFPPTLIPRPFNWRNYSRMFTYLPFTLFYWNTIYITALTVFGTFISCSLVAYSFARLRWPGRDLCFIIMLSTMMLPPQVTMIPIYLVFKYMGWIDTFKPLTVPAFFGNAFSIFLLRQFYMTIPWELDDAAKIDGCSFFQIYWRIMLPLVKPALATITIFTFQGQWNNFLGPLIYINSTEKMPLALALRLFQTMYGSEWGLLMAASTAMTLPLVITFFFCQKYFIQGITLTGLKG
ncbi:MAG: carbohydrate ABC transporter permease [Firmicutes bacterium]|nr:carbohydrate ABC transporter permease [Bacillota bacterium]